MFTYDDRHWSLNLLNPSLQGYQVVLSATALCSALLNESGDLGWTSFSRKLITISYSAHYKCWGVHKSSLITGSCFLMKLSLKPVEIPFAVGETVWVDQSTHPDADRRVSFQARIVQIILDGSLTNSIVIRKPGATHEVAISNAIYDLKPTGENSDLPRVSVDVSLLAPQESLFETQNEMLDYQAHKTDHQT